MSRRILSGSALIVKTPASRNSDGVVDHCVKNVRRLCRRANPFPKHARRHPVFDPSLSLSAGDEESVRLHVAGNICWTTPRTSLRGNEECLCEAGLAFLALTCFSGRTYESSSEDRKVGRYLEIFVTHHSLSHDQSQAGE